MAKTIKRDMRLKALYRKLKENNIVDYTEQAFQKYVRKGRIPYDEVNGTKWFNYAEVVLALRKATVQLNVKTSGKDAKTDAKTLAKLSKLPLPNENESEDEYRERVASTLGANPSYEDVKIYHTLYMGKLAEQKYKAAEGLLIERSKVTKAAFEAARRVRDAMLSIPERASGELLGLTDIHDIKEVLYNHIEIALSELNDPKVFMDE
jgi:hypothetical protein